MRSGAQLSQFLRFYLPTLACYTFNFAAVFL